MDTIVEILANNPQILKEFPTKARGALENIVTSKVAQSLAQSQAIAPPSVDESVVNDIIDTSSSIFNSRVIITFILLAWAIFLIVMNFVSQDQSRKEQLNTINTTLFGYFGIIPIIILIWIGSAITVSIVPALVKTLPKFTDIFKSITTVLAESLVK